MSISYTTNTRSDIAISGEILPSDANGVGGTVFVIASVYRNRLYYLLRWNGGVPPNAVPFYQNSYDTSRGIITNINEYAWVEAGITYYVKDLNGASDSFIPPLDSGYNPDKLSMNFWSRDYFKWRKDSQGSIFFDIYSSPSATRPATIYKSNLGDIYNKPTLKYEIFEPTFNICGLFPSNNYKNNKWYFTPHFIVSENIQTFMNSTDYYPGCDAATNKFYPTDSTYKCTDENNKKEPNDQNSNTQYSRQLLTDDPPGIGVSLGVNTKLWSGITYYTDADPKVYTQAKATGAKDNHQEDYVNKTRMFGQQPYYQAAGTVANNLGGGYGGLPNGFLINMVKKDGSYGNAPNSTFQFYNYKEDYSYCGPASFHVNTTNESNYPGFKFILIPVSYFNASGCTPETNPIYSYCSSAIKSGLTGSEFYKTYCSPPETGFTNITECKLNQGSLPYYYPKFAYDGQEVITLNCGKTYNDAFQQDTYTSLPSNNIKSIFGDSFPGTAVNYNNSNPGSCAPSTYFGCCSRNSKVSNPTVACDPSTCNGGIVICTDGNTENCSYVDPSGVLICTSDITTNCAKECTPSSSPDKCETINCSDYLGKNYTPAPGCLTECTSTNDPAGCYYFSEVLNNWVCGSGNTFPPRCINPTTQPVPCNPSGIGSYPGCVTACQESQTPDDGCNYYIQDPSTGLYFWVCDDQEYPPGCKDLCSITNQPTGCVTIFCDDEEIEGCIPTCKDGQDPVTDGCVYYSNGEWICNPPGSGFPKGCVDVCTTIDPFTGLPSGCKAITCDSEGYPENCFETITSPPVACTAENTPSGCVWKTGDSFICQSIDNPSGCVYMLDSNGNPPSWSNADCSIAGKCVKVTCDANSNPPGCIPAVIPDDNTEGGSVWLWLIIVFGVIFAIAIIAGIIYAVMKNKRKDEKKNEKAIGDKTKSNESNEIIANL